ncbi:scavenger receptor class F member 2 isoform X1 [Zootoca vivipara]|uniref:scavenger receptor class F member 2 isoform X1 n=2 Tax=Zootoca vivipara TaxID=8524 RepID=UPI00293C0C04|nr:scavenger receptor class F member 2 isoform X1 [Zootoca vivipara]
MRHFLAGRPPLLPPPRGASRRQRRRSHCSFRPGSCSRQQPGGAGAAAGEPGCPRRAPERMEKPPRRARRAGDGDAAVGCSALLLSLLLLLLLLLGCGAAAAAAQELNPRGRNVCPAPGSAGFVCCSGWRQQGEECLIAACEGNFTCKDNEVCVRPNECRCRHGYFGANCETKCPRQFWGPDCKEMCHCHPNGQCEDVTGQCTCNANRWGPKCENACLCKHGKCDQKTGKCTCEPNWWGPQCSSACYCSLNSQCDQQVGTCICQPGWWGRSCNNQCSCNNSPCEQFTGRCQCRGRTFGPRCDRYCQCHMGKCNQLDGTCACEPGYRGKFCREPCPAGFYGQGCRRRCGQCKELQPCTIADGRCLACEAGWNGTKCDQICSAGFYGEGCDQTCPPCKDGHTCNHINGKCSHCNPGWIGDRCETKCRNGTYGENCAFVCNDCFNGTCDFESGRCLCRPGFQGIWCNVTCQTGHYGVNCSESCKCHEDSCDPLTGSCYMEANQRMGVIGAGALLAFLLLLLLSLLCCCCVCRKKDHSRDSNQDPPHKKSPRRLCGRFSRISMKLPRIPLRRQKLPKVVVAHHDLENTMNCSFIEPPSVVEQPSPSWSSRGSFSSFDTTDEGPVYCVPHEESVSDSKDRVSAPCNPVEKVAPPISEEEAGEYTVLKESPSIPVDSSETPLLKSSDSERSSSGSGSVSGALYARIARLSKQSRDEDDNTGAAKPPSPERAKPPPPDPSTKPKVSWIHSKYSSNQSNSLPAIGMTDLTEHKQGLAKRKRSPSETLAGVHGKVPATRGKEKAPKHPRELSSPEGRALSLSGEQLSPSKLKQRHKASAEQMENINGAVQNVIKKMSSYPPDRKGSDAPKSPSHSKLRSEVIHPHLSSEAATLLAAQLKEKTQSLNRGDGGARQNGVSPLPAQREKPTPPQKAKRSVAAGSQKSSKPVLPTSPNLQKLISPVAEAPAGEPRKAEKPCSGGSQEPTTPVAGDQVVKKTPIKKPPRKKSREAAMEQQPKAAATSPQTVQ